MTRTGWVVSLALVGVARCAIPPESDYVGDGGADANADVSASCDGSDLFARGASCYRLVADAAAQASAEKACNAWGGHLAAVTDSAENTFVGGILQDAAVPNAWIGLEYDAGADQYVWTTGEPFSYSNFVPPGPPDPLQTCVVQRATPDDGWMVMLCDAPNAYVCER